MAQETWGLVRAQLAGAGSDSPPCHPTLTALKDCLPNEPHKLNNSIKQTCNKEEKEQAWGIGLCESNGTGGA